MPPVLIDLYNCVACCRNGCDRFCLKENGLVLRGSACSTKSTDLSASGLWVRSYHRIGKCRVRRTGPPHQTRHPAQSRRWSACPEHPTAALISGPLRRGLDRDRRLCGRCFLAAALVSRAVQQVAVRHQPFVLPFSSSSALAACFGFLQSLPALAFSRNFSARLGALLAASSSQVAHRSRSAW